MKVIAVMLSLYFLSLNFVPCSDVNSNWDDAQTEFIASSDFDHDHNAADLCSPFCNCHCCHIHAAYFNQSNFTATSSDISSEVFFHNHGLEKDFNNSILQPPRV